MATLKAARESVAFVAGQPIERKGERRPGQRGVAQGHLDDHTLELVSHRQREREILRKVRASGSSGKSSALVGATQ